MELFSGALGIIVIGFLVVLSVLWFILPFAVFGIKNRLDNVVAELRELRNTTAYSHHEIRKTNQILKVVHNVAEED